MGVKLYDAVQYADLFVAFGRLSQAPFDFQFERCRKLLLIQVEMLGCGGHCEVVAMHHERYAPLGVPIATG